MLIFHGQNVCRRNFFFQNTFMLIMPGVVIFADIIKIGTMFNKKILKLKELEIMYQNTIDI